jgi:hypothetical protein
MPSCLKPLKRFSLALGLAVAACNVYNPSGEGDGGTSQGALMAEGEELFRQLDYEGAQAAFEAAIKADSNNSMAYYGYSKSVMRYWDVKASDLLTEVSSAKGGGIPFIGASDWNLTRYLKSTSKVRKALGKLTERDTLTRWYYYTLDPTSKAYLRDKDAAKRVAFMAAYWAKADGGMPGYYKKSQFPLSDLKMGYQKVIADFGFVELVYGVAKLRDLNGDDSIGSQDDLIKKLAFNTDGGGFKVDNLASIQADLATNPESREQLNNLISNVSSGLASAGTVIDLLGPALAGQAGGGGATDTAGLSEKVTENMDSVITSLGNAVTFYQFGDAKDNDGDGCVDEEIMDGKDNDGDSFTDEDARIVPIDTVDNDWNGKQGSADPDELAGLIGADAGILLWTKAPGWTKGPKYADRDAKIGAQKDSIAVKVRSGRAISAAERSLITTYKADIGGCWNNY